MKEALLPITQIGSLPYDNVNQAVEYSLKHGIPFLPELPKLEGFVLDWIKNPGNPSCLSEFARNKFTTVKIQCIGPATLVVCGYNKEEAVERVLKHVSVIAKKIEAKEMILFLDEPALGQAGFNFEDLWSSIFQSFPVIPGVHCCGNMDWDILFKSPVIDFISFDATQYDITKYPYYRNGKRIAWGIEKREDVKDFQNGDLITPPCGLSPLKYTVDDCVLILRKLQNISREFMTKS